MDLLPEKLSLADYKAALEELKFGKVLPTAVYVIADDSIALPKILEELVNRLRSRLEFDDSFNVIKLGSRELKVSFLSYPEFFTDPHPHLSESVGVNLVTGKVRRTQYGHRENPPILHRKETFLPNDHPDIPKFRRLTKEEEEAGLYEDTSTIGFKLNWERLLAEKGLGYRGHRLIRLEKGNQSNNRDQLLDRQIDRHRAAIARSEFSKPIKLLLNHDQLRHNDRLFDYGCGLGDDVNGLNELNYTASGWDPFFAPHEQKQKADVVNLGFVLNVII